MGATATNEETVRLYAEHSATHDFEALGRLRHPFGVVCFDGQGYAHPRRCGLASHAAITLGVPPKR